MTGALWDEVGDLWHADVLGTLPDVRIDDVSLDEWQELLDLFAERRWRREYRESGRLLPSPSAAWALAGPEGVEAPELRVWPADDVLVVVRFRREDRIDLDVDLRELRDRRRFSTLCGFIRDVGRLLDRPVSLYPEGANGEPVIGYTPEADDVIRLTPPSGE
ncbi:hypothetical protein LX16_4358 [Stackebrandtia albiflava]|uniref:Uncharacterized protein n=1 Tax=Stackebrandtia albiflava TaxID=406432 RepID=A0A562URC0_9ACTN|nr:hypothetical protein [Stackebrandtia albiflava]TWJ08138.1 hypothetical protein LX16_4358 [Stackebrandtia albiflava]